MWDAAPSAYIPRMRLPSSALRAPLLVLLATCTGAAPSSIAERLPGTYTAHETAATITYVVKRDGTATLSAVTNLGEKIGADASYTVAGDTATVRLVPQGGGAPRALKWTLRGDSLVELDAEKRTVFVREGK